MLLISFLSLLLASPLQAALEPVPSNKPLYEWGVAAGAGYVPDYPASDQGRLRYIIFPQFRYRGMRFRSDEEDNLKARFLLHPLYGIDFSASGAFSSNSDQNDARKGMKDLDWLGEIGPRFYLFLVKTDRVWVRLFFPLRIGSSTDFTSITYQGLVFAPSANVRYYFDNSKFNSLILSLTRSHTTHQIQEYYFQVDRKDATSERPEYDAKSGYLGSSASLVYIYEKEDLGLFGGISVSSYQGAANAGSPLHTADYTTAAFFGVSYLFYHSEARGFQ
jgi:hypothetical protein